MASICTLGNKIAGESVDELLSTVTEGCLSGVGSVCLRGDSGSTCSVSVEVVGPFEAFATAAVSSRKDKADEGCSHRWFAANRDALRDLAPFLKRSCLVALTHGTSARLQLEQDSVMSSLSPAQCEPCSGLRLEKGENLHLRCRPLHASQGRGRRLGVGIVRRRCSQQLIASFCPVGHISRRPRRCCGEV